MSNPLDFSGFGNCISAYKGSDEYVQIPEHVTKINTRTFMGCNTMHHLNLGNVEVIEFMAFKDCTALQSVVIPDTVKSIGISAFEGCTALESIVLPDSVKEISPKAFKGCTALKSLRLPASLKTISSGLLEGCTSLENLTIPNGVETVDVSALSDCDSLEYIRIPNSVTHIESSAIPSAAPLTILVDYDGYPEEFVKDYGYSYDFAFENSAIENGMVITDGELSKYVGHSPYVEIPDYVTKIKSYAFEDKDNLTGVSIPNSVIEIEDCAFYYCGTFAINAPLGSAAEAYAKENDIPLNII